MVGSNPIHRFFMPLKHLLDDVWSCKPVKAVRFRQEAFRRRSLVKNSEYISIRKH